MKNIVLKDVPNREVPHSYAHALLSTIATLHGRIHQMFHYQLELHALLNKYAPLEMEQVLRTQLHEALLEPTLLYACVKNTIIQFYLNDDPTFLQRFGLQLNTSQKLCRELAQLQKRFEIKALSMEEVAIQRDIRSSASSLVLDLLPNVESKFDFLRVHQLKLTMDIQKIELQRDDYKRQLQLLEESVSGQQLKQKDEEIEQLNKLLDEQQNKIELLEQELRLKNEIILVYAEQIRTLRMNVADLRATTHNTNNEIGNLKDEINELKKTITINSTMPQQFTPVTASVNISDCKESSFTEALSLNLSSVSSSCSYSGTPRNFLLFKDKRNAKLELVEHLVAQYLEHYEACGKLLEIKIEGLAQAIQDEVKRQIQQYTGLTHDDAPTTNRFIQRWRSLIADVIARYTETFEEERQSFEYVA